MPLTLTEKKDIVTAVGAVANRAVSAVIVDYRGLTANQMTELRSQARKVGVYLRIVRNSLARQAFEKTEFSCLEELLVGPVFIALSMDSPSDAPKMLQEFLKNFEKLQVKAISLSGKVYEPKDFEMIANLPNRDEALAQLMHVMKAPIEKLVRTLVAPVGKLVRTFAAIKDKK